MTTPTWTDLNQTLRETTAAQAERALAFHKLFMELQISQIKAGYEMSRILVDAFVPKAPVAAA